METNRYVAPLLPTDYNCCRSDVKFLEYASQGKVVATGYPYSNRYVSVITLKDRKVSHWRDYLDPVAVFDALGWPPR